MKEKAIRLGWFVSGALTGLVILSIAFASVPKQGRVTDDTAIYQNLSEIRAAKQQDLNFDRDLERLSQMEHQYRERVARPMKRVAERQYRASGQTVVRQ